MTSVPGIELTGRNELATIDRWELERRSRAVVQPVYLGRSVALCRLLARYKFFVDTEDVGFGANVLLDGFWEPWLTTFVARRVRAGDAAIDVGANHGYYALLMADLVGPGGRVAAVEPNPSVCRLLRRSLSINGFAAWTEVLQQAATDRDDQDVTLGLPDNEPKNAHLLASPEQGRAMGVTTVTAKGGRLATALRHWPKLDFVKIDVEGAEEIVIDGLAPLLEQHRPRMVLEFNPARCVAPQALLERLIGLYGDVRQIEFDGEDHPALIEDLLDTGKPEDRLLYLEADGASR